MSENNGERRPDGYQPNAGGENGAPVPSADEANSAQWNNQSAQPFQPEQGYSYPQSPVQEGFQPEGQGYPQGQYPYKADQNTQAFQPEGQGYPQYGQPFYPEGQGYSHDTQAFQASQGGQGYDGHYQPDMNQQDTQAFQPDAQGYEQSAYTPHETQAFGAQQYAPAYGADGQPYGGGQQQGFPAQQYGQQGYGHEAYPPSGQPGGYQGSYGGYDGTGGGGYPPYGGGYGQQPPKGKGPLIAWIVLGIILIAAIAVGILFGTGFFDKDDEAKPTSTETLTVVPTTEDPTDEDPQTDEVTDPANYGDDPALDALWDECAAGTLSACDELWIQTDIGTEYYDFANTCGDTTESSWGMCESSTTSNAQSYGDDPELDEMWDACEDGDMVACDDLWYASDYDSEYYEFSNTCGDTTEPSYGMCDLGINSGTTTGEGYGDDPELDELWDACDGGDFAACDTLWWDSPIDSEYEEFAGSCGGRSDYFPGGCEGRAEDGEF